VYYPLNSQIKIQLIASLNELTKPNQAPTARNDPPSCTEVVQADSACRASSCTELGLYRNGPPPVPKWTCTELALPQGQFGTCPFRYMKLYEPKSYSRFGSLRYMSISVQCIGLYRNGPPPVPKWTCTELALTLHKDIQLAVCAGIPQIEDTGDCI